MRWKNEITARCAYTSSGTSCHLPLGGEGIFGRFVKRPYAQQNSKAGALESVMLTILSRRSPKYFS